MPLGDSTTAGLGTDAYDGAYRTSLETRLLSDGRGFNFVGSGTKGPPELNDKDHEGHGGFRINDVAAGVAGYYGATPPDVVLLMIGTNDIRSGPVADLPLLTGRLGSLLDQMWNLSHSTHIVVASILPQPDLTVPGKFDPARAPALSQYNGSIPGLVNDRAAQGRPISFANVNAAVSPGNVPDGSHANAAGNAQAAGVFRNALVAARARLPGRGSTS